VLWEDPKKSNEVLSKAIEKNADVYDFEKMLEAKSEKFRNS